MSFGERVTQHGDIIINDEEIMPPTDHKSLDIPYHKNDGDDQISIESWSYRHLFELPYAQSTHPEEFQAYVDSMSEKYSEKSRGVIQGQNFLCSAHLMI